MVGSVRNGLTSARKVGARDAIESPFETRDPIPRLLVAIMWRRVPDQYISRS